jgi:hypothetical protein
MSAVLVLVSLLAVTASGPADVAGTWKMTVEMSAGTGHPTLTLAQDGGTLTGTYAGRYGASKLEGKIEENRIQFTVRINAEGTEVALLFIGIVEDDTMTGQADLGEGGEATWSATRDKEKKPGR